MLQLPLRHQTSRLGLLVAPNPPKKVPFDSPYRANDVITAAQLFENRPDLGVPAVRNRGAITTPYKPVDVAMTSSAPEPRASIDATDIPKADMTASSDRDNMQVAGVSRIASLTTCLRPQRNEYDDRKCGALEAVPTDPSHFPIYAVCASAETTRDQETQAFIPQSNEPWERVESLPVKITEQHESVSRKSREVYAIFRGRVLKLRGIQDYLLVKASQRNTGLAESRILRGEAEVFEGLTALTQKVFDISRQLHQDSELGREVAEVWKAVDALCDAVSLQESTNMAGSAVPKNPSTIRSIDADAVILSPASRMSSEWSAASAPLEERGHSAPSATRGYCALTTDAVSTEQRSNEPSKEP